MKRGSGGTSEGVTDSGLQAGVRKSARVGARGGGPRGGGLPPHVQHGLMDEGIPGVGEMSQQVGPARADAVMPGTMCMTPHVFLRPACHVPTRWATMLGCGRRSDCRLACAAEQVQQRGVAPAQAPERGGSKERGSSDS